jgi:hypothetical protein
MDAAAAAAAEVSLPSACISQSSSGL